VEVDISVAVAMGVGSFIGQSRLPREPFFSDRRAGGSIRLSRHRL